MSQGQALMEAEKEFRADLPDGLDTECSFMMNIEDGYENKVGWICFKYYTREEDGQCYVFLEDLRIYYNNQRKYTTETNSRNRGSHEKTGYQRHP